MHFVNSVRWHSTILLNTTRLNDIDWAVWEGCFGIGSFDGFTVLIIQFNELGEVNL